MSKDCGVKTRNVSKTNCVYKEMLPHNYLASKIRGFKMTAEDAKDKTKILALIEAGTLIVLPKIAGANGDNTPAMEAEVNEFGFSFVADTTLNTALNLKIDTSACMMDNLETWNGLDVYAFKVDVDEKINGIKTIVDGVEYLESQPTKFYFRKPGTRISKKGQVKAQMIVLMDNDRMNSKVSSPGIMSVDGIIDLEFSIDSITNTEIVVRVEETCNDNPVLGLDGNIDFERVNADGTGSTTPVMFVPTSIVDNLDSTYTATFAANTYAAGMYIKTNLSTTTFSPPSTDTIYGEDVSAPITEAV